MVNSMKYKVKQIAICLKLIVAYCWLHVFRRSLLKKEIWLIMEKKTEARDNGYHFYKYIKTSHANLNAYYVITGNSADISKISELGNIIEADSFKHYVYYLAAKYSINSQAFGAAPGNPRIVHKLKKHLAPTQKTIFLQHGIIKDDMTNAYRYDITKFDLFCCGAQREHRYIIEKYGYPEKNAKLLGLCRFDRLYSNRIKRSKQILIMPTFRNWLQAANVIKEASAAEMNAFLKTDYYQQYVGLISDAGLLEYLGDNGYKLVFYPHYAMQSYIKSFEPYANDVVEIGDRKKYDVQDLLIESGLLVTDYSSVYFDFAYMKKPVIYFQFDEHAYRSKHYKEGYFDYRRDGFGPVIPGYQQVIDRVKEYIEADEVVEDIYLQRTEAFFGYNDAKNCERTYRAILEIE